MNAAKARMYIGAAISMLFLRAWKMEELKRVSVYKEKREQEIWDNAEISWVRIRSSGHTSGPEGLKSAAKACEPDNKYETDVPWDILAGGNQPRML